MKKISILIVTFCMFCNTNAQKSKREEGIKFGIKGGINASNFNGDIEDNKMRYGLHIGLLAEIIINDQFSLQPEAIYSAQGFKNETPGAFSKSKFDYINLPVLIKYYPMNNFSIEAGPQIGFLINAIDKSNAGNADIDDQNVLDFSINAGVAYKLQSGIFFQARYSLGIINVNGADNASAFKYTNSVFQLSIGCLF